jgi:uncharacterized membrane protein
MKAAAASKITVPGNRGTKVVKSVSILQARSDLYDFWRSFGNLAQVIKHPVEITELSETESLWKVSGPPGESQVEWRAEVINDVRDQLIAWQTTDDADIPHAGTVRFSDGPPEEGTEVTVTLEYDPPGGKIGQWLGKLSGVEPAQQVADTLRRFKALMEAGEIPTIIGQSAGGPQAPRKGEK